MRSTCRTTGDVIDRDDQGSLPSPPILAYYFYLQNKRGYRINVYLTKSKHENFLLKYISISILLTFFDFFIRSDFIVKLLHEKL